MGFATILESHGIRCPESPTLMACPQCGSVEEVCEKCHQSIQTTVRRADGWREWEQVDMGLESPETPHKPRSPET